MSILYQQHGGKWPQVHGECFLGNITKNMHFAASMKFYQFMQLQNTPIDMLHVILCKHITLVEQIKREDNKVPLELLMMKSDQILNYMYMTF